LHSFNANGIDGYAPFASLIFDATGNLYGTTEVGGASGTGCGGYGCGTVFELSPSGGSKWTETVLYSFTGGSDGQAPEASLILDAAGNLYGTTVEGGDFSGTVFELTPRNNRQWTEVQLHVFNGEDGENPAASLIFDAAGNLYSTISGGGVNYCDGYGCGNVFELSPDGGGEWALTILHSFDKRDGEDAQAGLAFDAAGNLYSTTYAGGTHDWGKGCDVLCGGTVFQLAPGENGTWTETVLHSFNRVAPDGEFPLARLVFDTAGNLYGTTTAGGSYGGGTVFEITR